MAMKAEDIIRLIKQDLPTAEVAINDFQGDQDHYNVVVTSIYFIGKSRIEQHKMVYKALEGYVGGKLHALSIHTKVPA
jgi:stress-induced morphogen